MSDLLNKIFADDNNIARLEIHGHKKMDCSDTAPKDKIFKAQLNPKQLSYKLELKDNSESNNTAQGESAAIAQFQGFQDVTLDLELLADATGVVPIPNGMTDYFTNGGKPSIRKYLNLLQNVVYGYEPESHGPHYLKLVWGNIFPDNSTEIKDKKPAVYKAKLKSCDITIELFSLLGEPIKAKVKLVLQSLLDPGQRPLGNSPDLTHYIDIKYGDNLPALCQEIYRSPDLAMQIAKINNLPSLYALEPGMRLIFPPLDKTIR